MSSVKTCTVWRRINRTSYFCCPSSALHFYNKTRKYDNVRVARRTLVKSVLNVSSTGCNNDRQWFAKLSYSAIDNVLINFAGLLSSAQRLECDDDGKQAVGVLPQIK